MSSLTPHLGASTVEAQISVAVEAAQLLIDFLSRGAVGFAVNMAAVDRAELAECGCTWTWPADWGCCIARCARAPSSGPNCIYRGDAADRPTRLITAAFAAGLLENRLDQNVNIVNARLLAAERGIEIVEQTNPQTGDFSTLIRADVRRRRRRTRRPARCSATSICGWCSWGRSTSTPTWTA